ncbi:MAG: retroviral-like aspartic protease family protein [Candidatus Bipolaricaulota bacterium]|nr:retroviral-like aspartic protease family protein [Candidatus Bipolaricaulota bacterium]
MGLTHVTVTLRALGPGGGSYQADFLVDTGATDSLAPATELRKIGVQAVGKMVCELANGTFQEYEFGLAQIEFMGEITAWCSAAPASSPRPLGCEASREDAPPARGWGLTRWLARCRQT